MEFRGRAGPGVDECNVAPVVIGKILEVQYGVRQKHTRLNPMHPYTYAEIEQEIRSLFIGSIFTIDTVIMHDTAELNAGSIIRTDEDIQMAINSPGPTIIIFITVFFPMNVIRTILIDMNLRLLRLENTMTETLAFLLNYNFPNMPGGQLGRGRAQGRGRGRYPRAARRGLGRGARGGRRGR